MEKKINEKKSLLREAEKVAPKEDEYDDEEEFEERQRRRARRRYSAVSGLLTKIIIILILIMIILGAGYFVFTRKFVPQTRTNITVVSSQLTLCQELITAKYKYSDIIALSKKNGLSKSISIIKYSGIIRIGIKDITLSDYEVYNEGKGLRITIPDVEVLGNDISGQELYDESQSLFIPISNGEILSAIENAKEKMLEEMINEGILDEARNHAKQIVQQMMLASGFEEVIVK